MCHHRSLEIWLGLAFMAALPSGCTTVAGGLAGGALLSASEHVATDGSQDVISLPIDLVERAARSAMSALGVDIVSEKPTREAGEIVRWDFEAAIVGDEIINVDVGLDRIKSNMTRVRVRARRGLLSPDLTTATMIVDRIVRAAHAAKTK